jgi:hypothetical protein
MNDLCEILKILLKYSPDGDVYAEHDQLFLTGPSPDMISEFDRTQLNYLMCHYDESTQSWYIFT